MKRYTYLGTSDEVTTCDCCGKSDLKKTVAISDDERGETLYFGTTCAARALKVQVADVRKGTAAADRAKEEAKRAAQDALRHAEHARWTAHLVAKTGGISDFRGGWDVFKMIQSLGGFKAAREGYQENISA